MLELNITQKEVAIKTQEEFVRGTVGAVCKVILDEFWQGYENTVVFKRDNQNPVNIIIDSLEKTVEIPHEILAESGEFKIGLFGVKPDKVSPTLWSDNIKIRYGTDTNGTSPTEYTPTEIDQLKLSKQDKLTAGKGITIEGNVISATNGGGGGGGGGGGTADYTELENKPQINGVELIGNKTAEDLGLATKEELRSEINGLGFVIANVSNELIYVREDISNLDTSVKKLETNIGDIETLLGGI